MTPKVKWPTEIFIPITPKQAKLDQGAQKRAKLAEALARGLNPQDDRLDFIRETAEKLLSVLKTSAEDFNKAHQDDAISQQDMIDVLLTTTDWLRNG
jgi:hypothetical protein